MNPYHIKVGGVFLCLVILCLGSVSGFAQDATPITAANAGNLTLVATLGDAEHLIANASVVFSPNSQYLAYANDSLDGPSVGIYDLTASAALDLPLTSRYGARWLAFGDDAVTAASPIGTVARWAFPSGDSLSDVSLDGLDPNSDPVLSADGSLAAGFGDENEALIFDTTTGKQLISIALDENENYDYSPPALSPDNSMIAFVNENGGVQIWSVADGTMLHALDSEGGNDIGFSPDSQMLAGCTNQSHLEMWNTSTGAAAPRRNIYCDHASFSPDGSLLVTTTSFDLTLWDIASGAQVGTYPGGAFAFSPDGHYLATVMYDYTGVTICAAPAGSSAAPAETPIPFEPTPTTPSGETVSPTEAPNASVAATCALTANSSINLRGGPSTTFDRVGSLADGQSVDADGQTTAADGFTWYRLSTGEWVRADLVTAAAECAGLAIVSP